MPFVETISSTAFCLFFCLDTKERKNQGGELLGGGCWQSTEKFQGRYYSKAIENSQAADEIFQFVLRQSPFSRQSIQGQSILEIIGCCCVELFMDLA
ncbi:MAG: hypothetical protein JJU37_06305 [Balneolaceae bacterium]|nr:hypothetical protein [Balneolaceae bacterium]